MRQDNILPRVGFFLNGTIWQSGRILSGALVNTYLNPHYNSGVVVCGIVVVTKIFLPPIIKYSIDSEVP